MAEPAGELPTKTGAPPQIQSEAAGAGWDTIFLKFLLLYYFAIFLFYFSSNFSDPINVVSLEMVCTVVRGDLGRGSSCQVDAGMLHPIALCDCPPLCSEAFVHANLA